MNATLPKHFYRVQGFANPADHHTLFDIYFTSWGVQTRIIRALLRALAAHVRTHYDPHTPADERDAELDDILSRVSFGRPMRSRGQRDGQPPATGAPGSDPDKASGYPGSQSLADSGSQRTNAEASASASEPPDAKEATATVHAR